MVSKGPAGINKDFILVVIGFVAVKSFQGTIEVKLEFDKKKPQIMCSVFWPYNQ